MGRRQCQVCNEVASKYKCPTCFIPYCSLGCFKRHKETPCVKPASPDKTPAPNLDLCMDRPLTVDDPSEVLQQIKLESLASSSEVGELLKDDELRKIVCRIDSSSDPENEFDKAMESEAFRIFTDKISNIVSEDTQS